MKRIQGLDSIRAICAIFVVMGHFGGPPITSGIDKSSKSAWLVAGFVANLWNGPAAVIVFFVISGFCIHFPFSMTNRIPSLLGYFSQRYIRIGVPLAVATTSYKLLGSSLELFNDSILWSLFAEMIYYAIYPILLLLRRAGIEWKWQLGVSFIISYFVAASNVTAKGYASYGLELNWLLGLPCWIAGCLLAEQVAESRPIFGFVARGNIWIWRGAMWAMAILLCGMKFHTRIGDPLSLNVFAIFVTLWLNREIIHYLTEKSPTLLEWAGKWSYSLYLTHYLADIVYRLIPLPNFGVFLNWAIHILFVLVFSYVFYLLFEFPSHLAARRISKAIIQRLSASDAKTIRPATY